MSKLLPCGIMDVNTNVAVRDVYVCTRMYV